MNIVLVEVSPDKSVLTTDYLPHPGLAYIAASLEQEGHTVSIVTPVSSNNDIKQMIKQIDEFKPQIVGFTATTSARFVTIEVIKTIKKETKAFIVTGGPHFHPTARDAMSKVPAIDCIVKGEGERIMVEIARVLAANDSLSKVSGIYYRENGGIVETQNRPLHNNLDSLPWPAYHLFDLRRYKATVRGANIPALGVISSRGCPCKCTFCSMTALQKHSFAKRSPELFLDEVSYFNKTYGYDGFMFNDDTITMDRNHITAICNGILKRKMDIQWSALARVNTVNRDMLSLMKSAGCCHITYGVESGSDMTLKALKKGTTVAQARRAVEITADIGIPSDALFIMSLPGETMEEAHKTIAMMNEFSSFPQSRSIYAFTLIFPGTEIESHAYKQGILPQDFSWNTEYATPIYRVLGTDPHIPCWETPLLPLKDLKASIFKSRPFSLKVIQVLRKLWTLSLRDIIDAVKIGFRAFTFR